MTEWAGRDFGAARVSIPTAADIVADDLRRLISTGLLDDDVELDAGTTLMARYGVSRPTLREALRVLAAERLLELTAGTRKARVRRPTIDVAAQHVSLLLAYRRTNLSDLRDAADLIDLAAVRTLAELGPDARRQQVRRLTDDHGDLRAAFDSGRTTSPVACPHHQAFVAVCGNRTLNLAAELTGSLLRQQADRSGAPSLRAGYALDSDLRDLVALLDAGDAAGVELAFRQHVGRCPASQENPTADGRILDLGQPQEGRGDTPASAGASSDAAAIAAELRGRIVGGGLAPGTRLATDMHDQYGVSRVTMRSAIRLLEGDGLLKVARGARGGVEVTRPTARQAARYLIHLLGPRGVDIHDYAVARRATMPLVVERMVLSIDDAGLDRLRAAAMHEQRMEDAGDIAGFARAAVQFQGTVAELSGSAALDVLTEVLDRMVLAPYMEMLLDPEYDDPRRSTASAHRHLVHLAAARDAAAARQEWAALTDAVTADFLQHGPRRRRRPTRRVAVGLV